VKISVFILWASICLVSLSCSEQASIIQPGTMLYDTGGNPINAHGGGIIKVDDWYYFYGEYRVKDDFEASSGVSCYRSQNLIDWDFEGIVLKKTDDTTSLLRRGCIIERPKVLYNAKNDNYVMWFHHELYQQGYDAALTGLAISQNPKGPFIYQRSLRPNAGHWPLNYPDSLIYVEFPNYDRKTENKKWKKSVIDGLYLKRDFESGQMARDMTLYEKDGVAYHIHSSENNQTLHISELDQNYTDFTGKYIRVLPGGANEAPGIFEQGEELFMITSGCTGWKPNAARLSSANDIMGEWRYHGNPVSGTELQIAKTFHSQSTFILPYGNQIILMADRWNPQNIPASEYVWLPISFDDSLPVLTWHDEWSLDK